jgi:hypothetical protein
MRAWTVAREAAFFDVEEREEAVAPSSTAAQKRSGSGSKRTGFVGLQANMYCVVWTRSSRLRAYNGRREVLVNGMNRLR